MSDHLLSVKDAPLAPRSFRSRRWVRLALLAGAPVFFVALLSLIPMGGAPVSGASSFPEVSAQPLTSVAATPTSLSQHVWRVEVSYVDGIQHVQMRLGHGATEEIGAQIADHYAAGDAAGRLEIVGNGFTLHRTTLRDGAFPPPPPAPTSGYAATSQSETPPVTGGLTTTTQSVLDRMDALLVPDLTLSGPDGHEIRVVYLTELDGSPRC